MTTITTKAPLPTDTAALKQYRLSSCGSWMPESSSDPSLAARPEAGWYLFEWFVEVEDNATTNMGGITLIGGGLKAQKYIDSDGIASSTSANSAGTSIAVDPVNNIVSSYNRISSGSLVMFLDGTSIYIKARDDSRLSYRNQFVFTRFAFPNGNDLGAGM